MPENKHTDYAGEIQKLRAINRKLVAALKATSAYMLEYTRALEFGHSNDIYRDVQKVIAMAENEVK